MRARTATIDASRARRAPASEPRQAALSWRHGLAPCLFYLFVEFVRPMAWVPSLAAIRPGMIAAVWGFAAFLRGRRRPIPRPVWYMFAFLALMVWHVPWSVNNRWALWGLENFSLLVLGGVLPLAVLPMSVRALRYLLTAYVLIHIPTAIHGLRHAGKGVEGWMFDENDLAMALTAAVGVAIYLLFESRSRVKQILLVSTTGLLLASVVATQSRGGMVGIALLGVYLLVSGPHRTRVLALVVIAGVGLVLYAPPVFWDELASVKTAAQPGDTGEQRLYFWGLAWKMFADHPVFGVGTNNYGIRAPDYQDPSRPGWGADTWGRVAHSLYFTLIAEHGIAGIVILSLVLVWCIRARGRARRAARDAPGDATARSVLLMSSGLLAGIVSVLATGLFLSVLYYPVLWVLVGMLASLDAVAGSASPDPSAGPSAISDAARYPASLATRRS